MGEIVYKVEEIHNYYTSRQEERIIGYATGNPEDIAEFFRARSQEMITVSPLEVIAVTPEIKVKKQLELTFGVYPVLINYSEEKDRISAVANKLHEMRLVDNEETVLFTAGVRTKVEHASNSIEIHKIKELRKFASS